MSETAIDNPPPTTEPTAKSRWRRPAVLIPVILVVLGFLVAAALAFQPQAGRFFFYANDERFMIDIWHRTQKDRRLCERWGDIGCIGFVSEYDVP